jgi:excinuclease ABC subunit C
MIHEVIFIDWKETESVLEAVILEAAYIKKFQPKYNVLGKDSKSWNYIAITKDEYPKVQSIREHDLNYVRNTKDTKLRNMGFVKVNRRSEFWYVFGPYPGLNMRAALKILRRLFRFSTCSPGAKRPCLYYEMGQCLGVCIGAITPKEYKAKVIRPLTWFLSGRKRAVIKQFEKEMKMAAKNERFEDASRLRDQLESLNRIHDVTLIDKHFFEDLEIVNPPLRGARGMFDNNGQHLPTLDGHPPQGGIRIEGYDISNLGAVDKVGSMVVFNEHGPIKSQYRKFTVKSVVGQSDVDSLAEILNRRLNHSEWQFPNVILIDGGRPQVNRVKNVFKERGVTIPFVGIAKGRERKRNDFILGSLDKQFVQWVSTHRELLINVRDEAHRFAITFNRSKRKIKR